MSECMAGCLPKHGLVCDLCSSGHVFTPVARQGGHALCSSCRAWWEAHTLADAIYLESKFLMEECGYGRFNAMAVAMREFSRERRVLGGLGREELRDVYDRLNAHRREVMKCKVESAERRGRWSILNTRAIPIPEPANPSGTTTP